MKFTKNFILKDGFSFAEALERTFGVCVDSTFSRVKFVSQNHENKKLMKRKQKKIFHLTIWRILIIYFFTFVFSRRPKMYVR
jgi:hypothetical protein